MFRPQTECPSCNYTDSIVVGTVVDRAWVRKGNCDERYTSLAKFCRNRRGNLFMGLVFNCQIDFRVNQLFNIAYRGLLAGAIIVDD